MSPGATRLADRACFAPSSAATLHAGIEDEHIEPAVQAHRLRDRVVVPLFGADVGLEDAFAADVHRQDAGAFASEDGADGSAKPPGGAGDDGDATLEFPHRTYPPAV